MLLSLPTSLISFLAIALHVGAQPSANWTANGTISSSSTSSSASLSLFSSTPSTASTFGSSSSILRFLSSSSGYSSVSTTPPVNDSSPSSSSQHEVGDYVAQGVGITNQGGTISSSTRADIVRPFPSGLNSSTLLSTYSNSTQSSRISTFPHGALSTPYDSATNTSSKTASSSTTRGLILATNNTSTARNLTSTPPFYNSSGVPTSPKATAAVATVGVFSTYNNLTKYWNATTSNVSAQRTTSFVSGSVAAWSCAWAWGAWYETNLNFAETELGLYFIPMTTILTTNITAYSLYTLCDGFPRASAGIEGYTSSWTITGTFTARTTESSLTSIEYELTWTETEIHTYPPVPLPFTTYETVITTFMTIISEDYSRIEHYTPVAYTAPTPTCTVAPSDCASILAEYSNAQFTGGGYNATAMPTIGCWDPTSPPITPTTAPCVVSVPGVQLIYWPVTLESQDLCHYPFPIDITASPDNTAIPTAVAFGQTFTSDENCYLYYSEVIATLTTGNTVITAVTFREPRTTLIEDDFSVTLPVSTEITLPGGILTIASTALQSYRGIMPAEYLSDVYSFNFADLPPNPVPILAYQGQPSCIAGFDFLPVLAATWCLTIVDAQYAPALVYPTQFLELDPLLASCSFDYNGLYDPPTALQTAGFLMTTPTISNHVPTTPAGPGSSAHPVTPPPTTFSFPKLRTGPTGSPGGSGDPPSGNNGLESDGNNSAGSGNSAGGGYTPNSSETTVDVGGATFTAPASKPADGTNANSGSQGSGSDQGGIPAVGDKEPNDAPLTGAILTLGNDGPTITALVNTQGDIVVAQQTIAPGGPAATVSGSVISAAPGGSLVVANINGDPPSTVPLSQISAVAAGLDGALLTLDNGATTITAVANGNGGIVLAGQTIRPGGPPVTIGADVISALPGGSIVVASGDDPATIALSPIAGDNGLAAQAQITSPPMAVLTLGGEAVTAIQGSNCGVMIDGTTLPQGQIATIGDQTVSVAPGCNGIVVVQKGIPRTVRLIAPNPQTAVFTLGDGEVITATSLTGPYGIPNIIFGNATLMVGGQAVTTDGLVLSAGLAGVVMFAAPGLGSEVAGAIFTIGSSSFTAYEWVNAQGSTVVLIGGQTLTVGGAPVTLPDGEVVSAGTSGLIMVGSDGRISSVAYSAIPDPKLTATTAVRDPNSLTTAASDPDNLTILSPSGVAETKTAAETTSKKSESSRAGVRLASVLLAAFLVGICLL